MKTRFRKAVDCGKKNGVGRVVSNPYQPAYTAPMTVRVQMDSLSNRTQKDTDLSQKRFGSCRARVSARAIVASFGTDLCGSVPCKRGLSSSLLQFYLSFQNFLKDIDECESLPCFNGGKCSDSVANYTCSCAVGYYGSACQFGKKIYSAFPSFQNNHKNLLPVLLFLYSSITFAKIE